VAPSRVISCRPTALWYHAASASASRQRRVTRPTRTGAESGRLLAAAASPGRVEASAAAPAPVNRVRLSITALSRAVGRESSGRRPWRGR